MHGRVELSGDEMGGLAVGAQGDEQSDNRNSSQEGDVKDSDSDIAVLSERDLHSCSR